MLEREIGIGETTYLPNGFTIDVVYEDPSVQQRDTVHVGKVARYEAEHVVVGESLGVRAKRLEIISEEEGQAELSEPNVIAAATHIGDGDAHDRLVVMSLGMEPSAAAVLANKEKVRLQDEINEVAKEAAIRRELNGDQIRGAMKDGREGRKVRLTLFDGQGRKKDEIKGRTKETVMVPDNWYELPPVNPQGQEWVN